MPPPCPAGGEPNSLLSYLPRRRMTSKLMAGAGLAALALTLFLVATGMNLLSGTNPNPSLIGTPVAVSAPALVNGGGGGGGGGDNSWTDLHISADTTRAKPALERDSLLVIKLRKSLESFGADEAPGDPYSDDALRAVGGGVRADDGPPKKKRLLIGACLFLSFFGGAGP